MAKHGTLPEYLYKRHLEVGDKVNLNFKVDDDEGPHMHEDLNEHEVSEEASDCDEGQQEFDESSICLLPHLTLEQVPATM